MPPERPRVIAAFASTIDGKIGPVPSRGLAKVVMPRSAEDLKRLIQLRAEADAILIGASSVRLDDPDLALEEGERARRQRDGSREPYRIVVTHLGQAMSPRAKMFCGDVGGPTIVVHPAIMPAVDRQILGECARLVEIGRSAVDFAEMLRWLRTELDVQTLLCEGGGVVCAELLAMRAVDELRLTIQPRIVGGRDAPTLVAGAGVNPDDSLTPTLMSVERAGDELFLRYEFSATPTAANS